MQLSFKTILITSAISSVLLTNSSWAADKDDAPSGCLARCFACLRVTAKVVEQSAAIAEKLAPMASAIAVAVDPVHADQIREISGSVRSGLITLEAASKNLSEGEIMAALKGMGAYGLQMASQYSSGDDKKRTEIAKAVFKVIVDNPALLEVSAAKEAVGAAVTSLPGTM